MTDVRVTFKRVSRTGDVVMGEFDVELPSGARTPITAFAGRTGITLAGLWSIVRRDWQNQAAGLVREAMDLEFAATASPPPLRVAERVAPQDRRAA